MLAGRCFTNQNVLQRPAARQVPPLVLKLAPCGHGAAAGSGSPVGQQAGAAEAVAAQEAAGGQGGGGQGVQAAQGGVGGQAAEGQAGHRRRRYCATAPREARSHSAQRHHAPRCVCERSCRGRGPGAGGWSGLAGPPSLQGSIAPPARATALTGNVHVPDSGVLHARGRQCVQRLAGELCACLRAQCGALVTSESGCRERIAENGRSGQPSLSCQQAPRVSRRFLRVPAPAPRNPRLIVGREWAMAGAPGGGPTCLRRCPCIRARPLLCTPPRATDSRTDRKR